MAAGWIKMRGALLEHPKVVALARILHDDSCFRDWLLPGCVSSGQLVSDDALRCVTCALLLKVWSVSREHGEFIGCDLLLRHSTVSDLDQIGGAPGIGAAMEAIGWAVRNSDGGVILPNFVEFNVPLTAAEKQQKYRERKTHSVTKVLPRQVTNDDETLPPEKSREEKSKSPKKDSIPLPVEGKRSRIPSAVVEAIYQAYPRKRCKRVALGAIRKVLKDIPPDELLSKVEAYANSQEVQSKLGTPDEQFIPHPATWFNQGRWMDESAAKSRASLLLGGDD